MHQTICACEKPSCPADTGSFYVTVIDHGRHGFLLGPYADHETALENVNRGRELASAADPRAHWYGFGTARVPHDMKPPTSVFGI